MQITHRPHPRPALRRHPRPVAALCALALLGATATHPVRAATGWTPAGPLQNLGSGRIWSVAISPHAPSLILAGTDGGAYRSLDSGATWSFLGLRGIRVWTIGFDARDGRSAYAGLDGRGIVRSLDDGVTWTDVSAGLPSPTVRSLAFGLSGIVAGTADGVALSVDGVHWRSAGLRGSSVSAVAVSANAPALTIIAGLDGGDISNGFLFRNAGGVATWEALQGGLPTTAVVSALAAGPLAQGLPKRPLAINTSKGTYHSGDGGTTWTASTGIPDQPTPVTLTVTTFSPLDPSLVYGGADAGGSTGGALMRSTDGAASFADASSGLDIKAREVQALAVSPTFPPALVAAVNPPGGQGVIYREVDGTAPTPPPLAAEAPGAPIPSGIPAPPPTPKPALSPVESPTSQSSPGPLARLLGAAFRWPIPLVPEIILVLLVAYVVVAWRQRYLDVEGPP